jgi:CRP/FNR family cyclic AMP-dependent transcriptional regulator
MEPRSVLKNSYLFRGVSEDDLDGVMAVTERKALRQGELVYAAGTAADAMFFVEMGTVEITVNGKEMAIITAATGQSFGELAFFRTAQRPVSALTREPTYLLRVPYNRLTKLFSRRPALALAVYRNASRFFAKHLELISCEPDCRHL